MKFIIEGGNRLHGVISASGNKNSVFPCIAASLLTNQPVTLHNIPVIQDTHVLIEILEKIGVSISYSHQTLTVRAEHVTSRLPQDLMIKLRGSIVLVGALLTRLGKVTFHHPGGDVIGKRSIETHLDGFKALGVMIEQNNMVYSATVDQEVHQNINLFLEERSVTGTENLLLAVVKRKGITVLKNCAEEPHVIDLCKMLISMGAKIFGTGTSTLTVEGVDQLNGTDFTIGADYIEIGTYAIAAGITKGRITIKNIDKDVDLDPICTPLQKFGVNSVRSGTSITFIGGKLRAIHKLTTNVWPGFPTDLMSPMIVLASQADGVTLFHDWMYESRMFFVDKLIAMGADIIIADPHRILINGPTRLKARQLESPDIRAGMALVLAALTAEGSSTIDRVELIERGYEGIAEKLGTLGAKLRRIIS